MYKLDENENLIWQDEQIKYVIGKDEEDNDIEVDAIRKETGVWIENGTQLIYDESIGSPSQMFEDSRKPDIETKRKEVIKAMSDMCAYKIINEFKSKAFDGVAEKDYDCELVDQSRLNGLVLVAVMRQIGATVEPIEWKAKGEIYCYEWQPLNMIQLGMDRKAHEELHTKRYAALKTWANDQADVSVLEGWSWDMEL